jgi:hypothetical protein
MCFYKPSSRHRLRCRNLPAEPHSSVPREICDPAAERRPRSSGANLTLGTETPSPTSPRTKIRGSAPLSRNAGEGLADVRARAPLPYHGRGGTQPGRAGWVRVNAGKHPVDFDH